MRVLVTLLTMGALVLFGQPLFAAGCDTSVSASTDTLATIRKKMACLVDRESQRVDKCKQQASDAGSLQGAFLDLMRNKAGVEVENWWIAPRSGFVFLKRKGYTEILIDFADVSKVQVESDKKSIGIYCGNNVKCIGYENKDNAMTYYPSVALVVTEAAAEAIAASAQKVADSYPICYLRD